MHPRYKTRYFTKECWPEEWIDEAISIAREIWIAYYRDSSSLSSSTVMAQAMTRASTDAKVCCHFFPYHHLLCPLFHIASLSVSVFRDCRDHCSIDNRYSFYCSTI